MYLQVEKSLKVLKSVCNLLAADQCIVLCLLPAREKAHDETCLLFDILVITSYSIHYTKLYEDLTVC